MWHCVCSRQTTGATDKLLKTWLTLLLETTTLEYHHSTNPPQPQTQLQCNSVCESQCDVYTHTGTLTNNTSTNYAPYSQSAHVHINLTATTALTHPKLQAYFQDFGSMWCSLLPSVTVSLFLVCNTCVLCCVCLYIVCIICICDVFVPSVCYVNAEMWEQIP